MTIGRVMDWTEARVDAIKAREEEEDEDEEREKDKERAGGARPPAGSTAAAVPVVSKSEGQNSVPLASAQSHNKRKGSVCLFILFLVRSTDHNFTSLSRAHLCLLQTLPFLIRAHNCLQNLHPLRLHLRQSYRVPEESPPKSGPHPLRSRSIRQCNNLPTFHLPRSIQILFHRPLPPCHSQKPPLLLAQVPKGDMR